MQVKAIVNKPSCDPDFFNAELLKSRFNASQLILTPQDMGPDLVFGDCSIGFKLTLHDKHVANDAGVKNEEVRAFRKLGTNKL